MLLCLVRRLKVTVDGPDVVIEATFSVRDEVFASDCVGDAITLIFEGQNIGLVKVVLLFVEGGGASDPVILSIKDGTSGLSLNYVLLSWVRRRDDT